VAMQKIQVGAILAVAATVIVVSALAASLLVAYQRIPNAGDVKAVGVGVYWDSACTSNVTSIDWESLEPGATANVTVYIQNEGTIPVMLNMTTDDWNSASAQNYITLIWNREGNILNSEDVFQAVLTLSVSSDISGITSFSFDITITGTEYT